MASVGLAVLVSAIAWLVIQSRVAGLFHDDGLYLVVARGLAEGEGYRLVSMPGAPWQTKYPFLLSSVMAFLWNLFPDFPENLRVLKLPQVIALGLSAWFAMRWYGARFGRRDPFQLLFGFLVASLPAATTWLDLTLTEVPFLALCLAALYIAELGSDSGSLSPRLAVLLGLIAGAAFLLRQAAAPLIVAGAVVVAASRRWRTVLAYATPVVGFVAPWLAFRIAAAPPTNRLLMHYVTYEPSALELGLREGWGWMRDVVLGNLAYLGQAIDEAFLLPEFPAGRFLLYPLIALGAWHWFRRSRILGSFSVLFLALYAGLIVMWPWPPGRYSLPIIAVLVGCFTAGSRRAFDRLRGLARERGFSPVVRFAAILPAAIVVLLFSVWNVAYFRSGGVWGLPVEEDWTGFEQTFEWIRSNTDPAAIVAAPYDPMVYLYTGRHAVRPWFVDRPWTYYHPRGRAEPDIGDPLEVRRAYDALGVDYLVSSPLDAYAEGPAFLRLLDRLLRDYAPPEYAAPAQLVFESDDGRHRVYELPNRRPP